MRVKFGQKIPNSLGKNARKSQGGCFLTHTVHLNVICKRFDFYICVRRSASADSLINITNNKRSDSTALYYSTE